MNQLIEAFIFITQVGATTLFVYLWVVFFVYIIKRTAKFIRDNNDNWPHGGATGGA